MHLPSPPAMRIGIVGGGIASAPLALDLCRHPPLNVQLFKAAPAFGEVGAGVSFGTNAVQAIEGLGFGEPYQRVADRTPAPWQDIWFEWRKGQDASYLSASVAEGIGQSSVHRADSLYVLTGELPDGNHQGAGANPELEGACALARLLSDTQVLISTPTDVLNAYGSIRRPRECREQRISWKGRRTLGVPRPCCRRPRAAARENPGGSIRLAMEP